MKTKTIQLRFKLFMCVVLLLNTSYTQTDELDPNQSSNINHLIELFRERNIDRISTVIHFPLKRAYPIPPVKNEAELKQRFHEIFDTTLINKIAHSTINHWSEVGWRGIMLNNGVVWIDSDEGKIIAVNYQSDAEKKQRKELIDRQKENVHPSLNVFEDPVYKIETKNYRIRIDELSDGRYRYASWKIDQHESAKPDLILSNGILEFQGSGGNHVITFSNGNYTYSIYRNIIGERNTPDCTLEVKRKKKVLLTEGGMLITE